MEQEGHSFNAKSIEKHQPERKLGPFLFAIELELALHSEPLPTI
jgi:hypothetical protein